ncbi:hypothetical protein BASA81_004084 [Batrachochytrium salamandrivorans]|nr:hypothetical protein BASA81_004084 [Batrachochytrium salamandrivorans]
MLAVVVGVAAAIGSSAVEGKLLGGSGLSFLVVQRDGSVYATGRNDVGQLGLNFYSDEQYAPLVVPNLPQQVVDVCSKGVSSCVITGSGLASCTGLNTNGQLGDGTAFTRPKFSPVLAISQVKEVFCGDSFTCAVTEQGAGKCWGDASTGVLGIGNVTNVRQTTPVPVVGFETAGLASISTGQSHACFLHLQGRVYCTGLNTYGQLGLGNAMSKLVPTLVSFDITFASVACGGDHTCAATAQGAVWCWGQNWWGQLGDGTLTSSLVPVLALKTGAQSVWLGHTNSFVLMLDGTARGFGDLSNEARDPELTPVVLATGKGEIREIRGGYLAVCVLLDQAVCCMGDNSFGQLGLGNKTAYSSVFAAMPGLPSFPANPPTAKPQVLPTKKTTLSPSPKRTKAPVVKTTKQPTPKPTKKQPTKKPTRKAG